MSKIVFTGRLDTVVSGGIQEHMFLDDECRELFVYICMSARKYKMTPSLDAVKYDRPDFEWLQTQESIEWIMDRFKVLIMRRFAADAVIDLSQAIDDPERNGSIDIEFLEVARRLVEAIPSNNVDRFSDVEVRIRDYEKRQKEGKMAGIPFAFPTLDRLTGGIQPHELVSVLGWTNIGKSTLLRILGYNIWQAGFTPLYISLEMEATVILRIFDAMSASMSYDKMKQLKLTTEEIKGWRAIAKQIKKKKCDIPVIDSHHKVTPDQIFAEIIRHKPDVVIIDYIGLMRSSSSTKGIALWQQIAEITQDLKHISRTMKVPIVMAAQTNRSAARDGADLENVGNSISIVQDSDIVLGLHQDEDMQNRKEMEIRLIKNRDGKRGAIKAIWDHDTPEFREKTMKDLMTRMA